MPAHVTTPSSPPNASTAARRAATTSSSSPTSAAHAIACRPQLGDRPRRSSVAASAARSTTATAAPSAARRVVVAAHAARAAGDEHRAFESSRHEGGRYPRHRGRRVPVPRAARDSAVARSGAQRVGSPFYAVLLELMAADVNAGGPVASSSPPDGRELGDAVPLRAPRRRAPPGARGRRRPSSRRTSRPSAATVTRPRRGRRSARPLEPPRRPMLDALTRPPQTNEVGRSARSWAGSSSWRATPDCRCGCSRSGAAPASISASTATGTRTAPGSATAASPVRFIDLWAAGHPPFETAADRRAARLRSRPDRRRPRGRPPHAPVVRVAGPDRALPMLAAALDVAR